MESGDFARTHLRTVWLGESSRIVTACTLVGALLVSAGGVALARALGSADRGRVAVTLAVVFVGAIFASRGVDTAIRVMLPGEHEPGAIRAAFFYLAATAVGPMSVLLVGPAGAAAVLLGVKGATALDGGFVVIFLGITVATGMSRGALYAERRANAAALIDLVGVAIQIVGFLIAAVSGATLVWYYLCYGLAGTASLMIGVCVLHRLGWAQREESAIQRKSLLAEGRRLLVIRTSMAVTFRVDRVLLGAIVGVSAAGVYAVAVSIAEIILLIPTAVAQVVLSRSASDDGTAKSSASLRRAVAGALISAIALALCVVPSAAWVIPAVYGPEYHGAIGLTRVLAFGSIAVATWRLFATDLLGRGQSGRVAVAAAFTAVGTVVIVPPLVARFGAFGAAWGSVGLYTVAAVAAITMSRMHGALGKNKTSAADV